MIQPNSVSTTNYDPENRKNSTHSMPNINKSNNKITRKRRNQTFSSFSSIISTRSRRSYRSYGRNSHLPWVLTPLARRIIPTTQNMISITMPPNQISDTEILQRIYDGAQINTSNPRTLQNFWDEYCVWLKFCKNLE